LLLDIGKGKGMSKGSKGKGMMGMMGKGGKGMMGKGGEYKALRTSVLRFDN
jgi:hypothetical protein